MKQVLGGRVHGLGAGEKREVPVRRTRDHDLSVIRSEQVGQGSLMHQLLARLPHSALAARMRERAAAVGGTLSAGPSRDGGFAVRAELPTKADG